MISKLKEAVTGARLRAGQMWRERKERIEEQRTNSRVRAMQDGKEIGFDRNPRRIRFAVTLATWGVLGFLVLWVAQTVGDVRLFFDVGWKWGELPRFDYDLAFAGDLLSLIVLSVVSFAIVLYSKAWVSYFMDTPWSDWGSKLLSFVLGIGGSAAIIMGGLEVNQHIRSEDYRGALVQEQAATQDRAAMEAQIASIDARLRGMRDQAAVGTYAAIAASVGVASYDANYLSEEALARTEPSRRDLVRRARGAAVTADGLETERLRLVSQLAAATPVAATAATVAMDDPVSRFINGLGPWRIVLVVLVGDLILLFGTYLADKREERARGYHVPTERSGWAGEDLQIEDLRADEAIKPQPMKPPREVVTDAETGEELIKVTPKPHWRKAKGKKQRVETQPVILPDETGVDHDGGARIASAAAVGDDVVDDQGRAGKPSEETEDENAGRTGIDGEAQTHGQQGDDYASKDTHPEPSTDPAPLETLSEEELDVLLALESAAESVAATDDLPLQQEAVEPAQRDDSADEPQHGEPAFDQTDVAQDEPSREPETNPARMIANVAAE